MKFYEFVARPSLLYGSETWVTTKRDMTRLEAAEMRFLRSVKGYTRLDKIRSEVIRKELEISGTQDMRLKYKRNWLNHLERMDNTTVAYPGSLFGGGFNTNSVEDRGQREQ